MEAQELIDFETDIAELFEAGKIPSPIHLSKGNEDDLIEVFNILPIMRILVNTNMG